MVVQLCVTDEFLFTVLYDNVVLVGFELVTFEGAPCKGALAVDPRRAAKRHKILLNFSPSFLR